MADLSLTILTEKPEDAGAIERLHERTFGPGRYARTAYRIREKMAHRLDLSFTARIGTLLVGSIRLTQVRIGETPALLLGPLTIEPPFRDRGIGKVLMERAMADAKAKGHRLVVLVGDEPYYARVGFKLIPQGQVKLDGPVDPARMLYAELVEGALAGVKGIVRPDWDSASEAQGTT
jgi:predicted N-acetyltransferase YhbS